MAGGPRFAERGPSIRSALIYRPLIQCRRIAPGGCTGGLRFVSGDMPIRRLFRDRLLFNWRQIAPGGSTRGPRIAIAGWPLMPRIRRLCQWRFPRIRIRRRPSPEPQQRRCRRHALASAGALPQYPQFAGITARLQFGRRRFPQGRQLAPAIGVVLRTLFLAIQQFWQTLPAISARRQRRILTEPFTAPAAPPRRKPRLSWRCR